MRRLHTLLDRARPRAGNAPLWAAALGVLPLPIWFVLSALTAPAPAWRAEYRPREASGPGAATVVFERQLSRYWDRNDRQVPGGVDVRAFSARWLACLSVDTVREVPFMLVASGGASFTLDGVEVWSFPRKNTRRSSGATLRLEPGVHALAVELDVAGWPSIALQASFDGAPPAPLASGEIVPGVRLTPPRSGATPCPSP